MVHFQLHAVSARYVLLLNWNPHCTRFDSNYSRYYYIAIYAHERTNQRTNEWMDALTQSHTIMYRQSTDKQIQICWWPYIVPRWIDYRHGVFYYYYESSRNHLSTTYTYSTRRPIIASNLKDNTQTPRIVGGNIHTYVHISYQWLNWPNARDKISTILLLLIIIKSAHIWSWIVIWIFTQLFCGQLKHPRLGAEASGMS